MHSQYTIRYDRETRDYAIFDPAGQLVGYEPTHWDAEREIARICISAATVARYGVSDPDLRPEAIEVGAQRLAAALLGAEQLPDETLDDAADHEAYAVEAAAELIEGQAERHHDWVASEARVDVVFGDLPTSDDMWTLTAERSAPDAWAAPSDYRHDADGPTADPRTRAEVGGDHAELVATLPAWPAEREPVLYDAPPAVFATEFQQAKLGESMGAEGRCPACARRIDVAGPLGGPYEVCAECTDIVTDYAHRRPVMAGGYLLQWLLLRGEGIRRRTQRAMAAFAPSYKLRQALRRHRGMRSARA